MWFRCRRYITHFLVNCTILFSIALGILPYGFNSKQKKISPSKYCLVYCILIDAIIIILALHAWFAEDIDRDLLNLGQKGSLMLLLVQFIYTANVSALFVIMWTNWSEYSSVLDIFNEFAAIDRTNFGRYSHIANECSTYDYYIIAKGLVTLLKNILFIYETVKMLNHLSMFAVLVMLVVKLMLNVILLVVLHFYTFVLITYRYFWILQQRLKLMLNHGIRTKSRMYVMQREVNEIIGVYIRLQRVCQQFGRIYGKQLLLCITGVAGINILTLFLLLIVWQHHTDSRGILYSLYVVAINTFDLWLDIAACELTLQTARGLAQLLRRFNDFEQLGAALQRELELLALVCATNPPNLRLCGLLDLNYSTGLKILLTMIMYLICIVQLSYMDL